MDLHCLELLLLAPVLGHVLYGIPSRPRGRGESQVALHNGDDFTNLDEAPSPDRLLAVRGVSATARMPLAALGTKAEGVRIDARMLAERPAYVVVETPPTRIELAPAKFESYLAHEGLEWAIQERRRRGESERAGREIYSKHIKVALADDGSTLRLLGGTTGLPLEFVPLSPLPDLRLRLEASGRPLVQAQVRVSFRQEDAAAPEPDLLLRTDAQGEVTVRVSKPGLWRLHAIHMLRLEANPEAEWKSVWTSLTFRVEA